MPQRTYLGMTIRGSRRLPCGSARPRWLALAPTAAAVAIGACLLAAPATARAAAGAGPVAGAPPRIHWGTVAQVPGLATLNQGMSAGLNSVSCWRAGDCVAGGSYTDASKRAQAFVVSEKNGHWGRAQEVPGTAALNVGGSAAISVLSCSHDGHCSAGGSYTDKRGGRQVFVVNEKNGHWGRAEEIPGTGRLNIGAAAAVQSISCTRSGNCSAGGYYQGYNPPGTGNNAFIAYVVSAKNGHWGKAEEVPGLAPLNTTPYTEAMTVAMSCSAAGNCSAGGFWFDVHANQHAFAVSEKNGHWERLVQPRGSSINAISCTSPGNCVAAGSGFVATQQNGHWRKPVSAPAIVSSVSCNSAGNCAAGGSLGYDGSGMSTGAFAMSERYGRWRKPVDLFGVAASGGQVGPLSCGSVGNCGAGGSYFTGNYDQGGNPQFGGFVVGERNGRWGIPELPPGLATLNPSEVSDVSSVSCPASWTCAAVGSYTDAAGNAQAFVLGSL